MTTATKSKKVAKETPMGIAKTLYKEIVRPEDKPAVAPKARKSNHPESYNFSQVGDVKTLTILKAGKQKKPAKQLAEILQYAKDNGIDTVNRKEFLDTLEAVREQTDENKAKYPQLNGSVQTMAAVVNHYWSVGQLKLAGVSGD
tara:strand:- start:847 stop:1278 length:432 start_codon:yes stop_codon:yes gene_type:complete